MLLFIANYMQVSFCLIVRLVCYIFYLGFNWIVKIYYYRNFLDNIKLWWTLKLLLLSAWQSTILVLYILSTKNKHFSSYCHHMVLKWIVPSFLVCLPLAARRLAKSLKLWNKITTYVIINTPMQCFHSIFTRPIVHHSQLWNKGIYALQWFYVQKVDRYRETYI